MEESSYKHNYEYLSIEEAKAIVNGTFVQGTTSIGGELAIKADVDKLLTTAGKKLTSIVPLTDISNEFICFFECEDIETFPDDLEHRWIEVSPIQFTFPADGGSVKITGSYGLTGTLGTRKKVGDIADTITADANATPSAKNGSKTYYYNNDQSQTPTAKVSWTQPNKDEEFPDDKEHRWIRVQPESSQISVDGGTINVTGSYGLTGTYGTEKKIGDITDTIVVESNSTQDKKSGSKTYYYNNNQSDTPTAKITWTQPGRAEEFPDDEKHRWIRVQPESSQISVDGGTINVTGSYGLTGTYGTEKKIGDITDTIVVESNSTQDKKSGSKTYYYNNNQSDTPTAKITWTQPGRAEEFPDDEKHRWIEITPTNAGNFPETGGTITVTGSYGLTGSFGTKKTVGNINDTITVEKNTTTQTKSGSKTYYYNNTPSTAPSATVTWTQDAHAIVTPTSVHVTNIILKVGQNQQIQYEVTPSNADIDTCTYEVTSGSNYVHITDGIVYADAVGKADCKITINGTVESAFQVSVTDNNIIDLDCDVIAIQNCNLNILLYDMEYTYRGIVNYPPFYKNAFGSGCSLYGHDGNWSFVDFDKLKDIYKSVKNTQSQVKGKTVEQMCQSPYGPAIKINFEDNLRQDEDNSHQVRPDEKRTYKILRLTKNTPSASIYYNDKDHKVHISGYDFKEQLSFTSLVHGNQDNYFFKTGTIVATNYFYPESGEKWSTSNLIVPEDGQYIYKGYQLARYYYAGDPIQQPNIDAQLLNVNKNGTIYTGQIKINSINGNTDISNIHGYLTFMYKISGNVPFISGDKENGLYSLTQINTLPYTFDFKVEREAGGGGLYVHPLYFYTTDKELINVHKFENDYILTESIVEVIQ